jgi:hypothetical protein
MWGNTRGDRTIVVTVALVAAIALAGCTAVAPGSGGTTSATSATSTPLAVSVPTPSLGPSPQPVPLTDAQAEQARLAARDTAWQNVLAQYPDAVRPDVPFDGYLAAGDEMTVMSACYRQNGVPVSYGYPIGAKKGDPPTSVGGEASTEQQAIGMYICGVEHPGRPNPPLTPEQLSWMYDYFTEFLVPCYEANGIDVPQAPSKQDFVTKWPHQDWFPSAGMTNDPDKDAAIDKACPPLT